MCLPVPFLKCVFEDQNLRDLKVIQGFTGHGNPGKSWISNLVNPGQEILEKTSHGKSWKISSMHLNKKLLSQVLAKANETCLISYSVMHKFKETGSHCP